MNDIFTRMLIWFAADVDVKEDEIQGYSIFPAGPNDEWSVEVFDGRERVSAVVFVDDSGEFSYDYTTLNRR